MGKAHSKQHGGHGLHVAGAGAAVLSGGHLGPASGLLDELADDEAVTEQQHGEGSGRADDEVLPRPHVRHVRDDVRVVLDDGAASHFYRLIATVRGNIGLLGVYVGWG